MHWDEFEIVQDGRLGSSLRSWCARHGDRDPVEERTDDNRNDGNSDWWIVVVGLSRRLAGSMPSKSGARITARLRVTSRDLETLESASPAAAGGCFWAAFHAG